MVATDRVGSRGSGIGSHSRLSESPVSVVGRQSLRLGALERALRNETLDSNSRLRLPTVTPDSRPPTADYPL